MTHHAPGRFRAPRSSVHPFGLLSIVAAALLLGSLAACSTTAAPSTTPDPSATPTLGPAPTPSASNEGLEHPTGASDVVLRFEEGGGFAPVDFTATYAPSFTLYGDGTVVFRDPNAVPPDPIGNVQRMTPFLAVRLDEASVQALLEEALGLGGLGVAQGPYMGMGADIPSATFTITIGGQTKQVVVVGLSPEMHPQDATIVTALARFADRLRTFADLVAGEQAYIPAAYRGTLIDADQAFGPILPWPWAAVGPDAFTSQNGSFLRTATLTSADVAELGVAGAEGGLSGLWLRSDAQLFSFALRPLLPDETS